MQVDLADRRLLVAQRLLGVLAPVIGRGDDDAVLEGLLAGRSEEAVDVFLLDAVVRRVVFALDGVQFVGALGTGDQINASVARVQSVRFGPFAVSPDLGIEIAVARLVTQIGADEVFEVGAFFALGGGGVAIAGEDVLERAHGGPDC